MRSMPRIGGLLGPALALLALAAPAMASAQAQAQVRIKDIVEFDNVRENQLVGYGLVVGLPGTGDKVRNVPFTEESMQAMLERMGINTRDTPLRTKNVAAVSLTATMPAFARSGSRIDVQVSALGDASSLQGGILLASALRGMDGQIYAMAQGNVAVGGLGVSGRDGSQVSVNVATVGRIADGASVERAVATGFDAAPSLRFNLPKADFLTAARVRDAINGRYPGIASITDGVSIALALPAGNDVRSGMMAEIEMLGVTPAPVAAKVIVNSRTGTVVINDAVRLAPAAVSHGKLVIRIDENPTVVQPAPFSQGETAQEESSDITVEEQSNRVAYMPGAASLNEIVDALNLLGVGASDLVVILESLKQAGSLQAEMVVM